MEKPGRDVDSFSSVETSRRDVEPFSSFGKPLSKGKRNRDLESVQDSQMERKKNFCPNKEIFLEKKADHAFQGEFAAQARILEAQSELDRREWRIRDADITLYETGMQLQSQRLELYRANQLTDQTRREKSWLCEELEMKKQSFSGRSCTELKNKLKNYEEVAVQRLKEFDN